MRRIRHVPYGLPASSVPSALPTGSLRDDHPFEKTVRSVKKRIPSSPAAPRRNHEPPAAVAKLGWRYHHLGLPTEAARPDETHLPQFGLSVSGFPTSPYGIEWMRFEKDSPLHPLIRTVAHVAFEVDDLDAALEGQEVIYPPGSPSDGVRAAMIVVDGAPVELIWFRDAKRRPARRRSATRTRVGRRPPR